MPTLHWIGKEKVVNHHRDVPFRVLEHKYGFGPEGQGTAPTGSGNKIIHGDNLEALKALLPEYEGRIKCIYIDPPYNTGNENWVYNDNVNDPKIKKWLGEVVGKESEDLTRHDKWLCMMYPRLQMLRQLLCDAGGVIFISIDDNEYYYLKLLCDEIFGSRNFLASFIWRRRSSSQLSQNNISVDHEYVLCYCKALPVKFSGFKKDYKNYANPDNDPNGDWTSGDLTVGMTKEQRPNQYFDLIDPATGVSYKPSAKRVWTYAPESMKEKVAQGQVIFPKTASGRPMLKRYLKNLKTDINPISTWLNSDVYPIGLNSEGTKVIQSIFGEKLFDYPKPVSLVQQLIQQASADDDIILDSFAGSGTTAHAVVNANLQDGCKRKFILIEMEDYADRITAERVKRISKGYDNTPGSNVSFDYYKLGASLFIGQNLTELNPDINTDHLREYIWYTETRSPLTKQSVSGNPYYLGNKDGTAYYFLYEKKKSTTLDYDFLATVDQPADQYVFYANNCLLPAEFMLQKNIVFKKITRDIKRF